MNCRCTHLSDFVIGAQLKAVVDAAPPSQSTSAPLSGPSSALAPAPSAKPTLTPNGDSRSKETDYFWLQGIVAMIPLFAL